MEAHVLESATAQGFDAGQAKMLAACARNVYAMGCGYHPNTITMLHELCRGDADRGEPWAVLLLRCVDGKMPRLRSTETANVRMAAARAAAERRKQRAN